MVFWVIGVLQLAIRDVAPGRRPALHPRLWKRVQMGKGGPGGGLTWEKAGR